MSEFDQLIAKSKDDLAAIAVQFGDFTADEASAKSREELIAAITRTPLEEIIAMSNPAPKKRGRPAKKKEQTTNEEHVDLESSSATPDEVQVNEKKTPARRGRPAGKKADQTQVTIDDVIPGNTVSPMENVITEERPAGNKTTRKSSKSDAPGKNASASSSRGRKSQKKQEPDSDNTGVSESVEAAPDEIANDQTEGKIESTGINADADDQKQSKSSKTTRRRRLSFGPEQETKEISVTDAPAEETDIELPFTLSETSEESAAPVAPVQPEIQYTEIDGILSIGGTDNKNDFCGFVHRKNYLPGEDDAYVPGQMIKKFGLRRGDHIRGLVAPPKGKDKYAPMRKILAVNDIEINEDSDIDIIRKRKRFENLTAIYPDQRLTLETGAEDLSTRIIDLFSPIGKGQRGMIVSPPKAGKTILLKKVANSITANNPDCKVIVLLIDERPEEVTDMQRSIKGEVVYSTFDKRPENHVRVTELVLERAMRLVELGQDVVILLDSMTRLARAYNLTINPTGRTLSGGLDPGSLYGPKRFFGAARNIEFGGSLTIIATALIETGSRMDEVIFEEFKGTGNMEVVLDRKLADRRMYPAIAVDKSGTRREDLLLSPEELESVWLTRKAIAEVDTLAATEAVINYMKRTSSNASFVLSAKKSFAIDS